MHFTINNFSLVLFSLLVGLYGIASPASSSMSPTAHIHPLYDDHDKAEELHAAGPKRQNPGAAARVGFLDEDPEAMAGFQQKVGRVVRDMMEHEIKKFVDNMSDSAMGQLTDQLLSFTLMGQRYLCLNIVRDNQYLAS